MLPVPETICPPMGSVCPTAAVSDKAAANSLRLEPLLRPRAISATGTQTL